MTNIVRPAKFDFRARDRQARHTFGQSIIEAAERALDEQTEDAPRLVREVKVRLDAEKHRESDR